MKSRSYIFSATFVAALLGLIGCSQITPVDVADVAKDLAPGSFAGTETRSKTVVDGLTMTVDEWTITDAAASKIEHTQYAFGNGVQKEIAPVAYTYAAGQMAAGNLGINYVFTPLQEGAEPLDVLFWGNALVIKGDTIGDGAAPIVNLKKIADEFSNHVWNYEKIQYFVEYDTIHVERYDTVKHVEGSGPNRHWVIDSVMVTIKDSIAADTLDKEHPMYYLNSTYVINHDKDSHASVATLTEKYVWYEVNEDKTAMVFKKDSLVDVKYHWGINQIVSAARFSLNMQNDETGEVKRLSLSGLDLTKNHVVTIGSNVYNMVRDEE